MAELAVPLPRPLRDAAGADGSTRANAAGILATEGLHGIPEAAGAEGDSPPEREEERYKYCEGYESVSGGRILAADAAV
jgi:hypothetical protein